MRCIEGGAGTGQDQNRRRLVREGGREGAFTYLCTIVIRMVCLFVCYSCVAPTFSFKLTKEVLRLVMGSDGIARFAVPL